MLLWAPGLGLSEVLKENIKAMSYTYREGRHAVRLLMAVL